MTLDEAKTLYKFSTKEERRDVINAFQQGRLGYVSEFAKEGQNRQHWRRVYFLITAAFVILDADDYVIQARIKDAPQ